MKAYKSHKVVQAAKILEVSAGTDGGVLRRDDGVNLHVTGEWLSRHLPEDGGYFVRYPDGYESYSPADAFESGYTELGGVVQGALNPVPAPDGNDDWLKQERADTQRMHDTNLLATALQAATAIGQPKGFTAEQVLVDAGRIAAFLRGTDTGAKAAAAG